MAECTQPSFTFANHGRRQVVARFDGGTITSDGGAVLLRQTEQRTGIVRQFADCFRDHRQPGQVEHSVRELVSQRVYGLALGYEDLNDHDQLRSDPLLALLSGKQDLEGKQRRRAQDRGNPGAGKSTLNRLEGTPADAGSQSRYKKIVLDTSAVERLLTDLYIQSQPRQPKRIVLDLDATDDPLHGHQEERFFHGYYGHYCYLPLYIFAGDQLLCARLRPSNIDASEGSLEEVQRIVAQLRRAWPEAEILLRADSGFCRDEIMSWCEANGVDYLFGLARNERLQRRIKRRMKLARRRFAKSGAAARVSADFRYRTRRSWARRRRVVGKAEYLAKGENPRFVVTSLRAEQAPAQQLYETIYCARGEMENRIKEQQLGLFADRTSTAEFRSNQIRLYFSSIGYCVLEALRRLGIGGDEDGAGAMHDDTAAVAQDRGADPDHGAQGVDFAGDGIPLGGRVRASVCKSRAGGAAALLKTAGRVQVILEADRARQGRQSRFGQKRTKNLSGAAADRIQGCFRLTAALLRGVAAQNDENLISRAPPAPFPGIGEKCGLGLRQSLGEGLQPLELLELSLAFARITNEHPLN